jgi:hypothetical protein
MYGAPDSGAVVVNQAVAPVSTCNGVAQHWRSTLAGANAPAALLLLLLLLLLWRALLAISCWNTIHLLLLLLLLVRLPPVAQGLAPVKGCRKGPLPPATLHPCCCWCCGCGGPLCRLLNMWVWACSSVRLLGGGALLQAAQAAAPPLPPAP